VEQGKRFVPVTTKVAPLLPAVALAGKIEAITGAAGVDAETKKGEVLEIAPELDTCTLTVDAETRSENGMTAVSCVELTNVVASEDGSTGGGFTAHWTTELFRKFVPVTVSDTAEALQDGVELDEVVAADKPATVGGCTVNDTEADAVPGVLNAVTWIVCVVAAPARSSAGTTAVRIGAPPPDGTT
jgi:hypothetical protein